MFDFINFFLSAGRREESERGGSGKRRDLRCDGSIRNAPGFSPSHPNATARFGLQFQIKTRKCLASSEEEEEEKSLFCFS